MNILIRFNMPLLSVKIPDDLQSELENKAANKNTTKSEIVRKRLRGSPNSEIIKEKQKRIESLENQIREVKENRRNAIKDKEDKIEMLQDQIQSKEDQIKELQNHIQELQEEKENTATFGEWVKSINPLARFFIKAGLMMAGWKIPERVKEEQE